MSRLLLPDELKATRPTLKRVMVYMALFELITLPAGIWGWRSGLTFYSVMPGAFMCGITGGGFLSVGIHAIRTGYMQRMWRFYRFSDRPRLFIMDSIMVFLGVVLSAGWPIGYSIQEINKQMTKSEQVMVGES